MRRRARMLPFLILLACATALPPLTGAAQDGPLRHRLRERLEQRRQEKVEQRTQPGDARTAVPIAGPGDYRYTMEHGGLQRMYRIHVPTGYDPARPAPLLFALHGGGGGMDYEADDSRYGLITLSERENLVVVFPNGYSRRSSGMLATWNAGNCCGAARDKDVDDVGFIRRVFERTVAQLNIDRQRVYATGMSNGAMMSYRLACEMSDVFKGIAAVAGTDNTRSCAPKRPVPILHIHARDDDHVQFNGGAGPGSANKAAVTDYTSVPATIAKWTQLDGCTAPARRTLDKPGAYCDTTAPCRGDAKVQLCVTETGGHSWPGAQKTRREPASQAISATETMWAFFSGR